ncbi:hypothetical protein HDU98_010614, partial [Podochytrium sp. JEL0797]
NLNCVDIDIISVHTYGDVAALIPQMVAIQAGGKQQAVLEEFGAQGVAAQASEIAYAGGLLNANGIPWLIWEVSSVTQANDYEFAPGSDVWNTLSQYALAG